jgi:hypothetical protein
MLLIPLINQPQARFLLLLAQLGKDSGFEPALPGVSQDSLAQMFGTTGSRSKLFSETIPCLGLCPWFTG